MSVKQSQTLPWPSRVLAFIDRLLQKPLHSRLPVSSPQLVFAQSEHELILNHLPEKEYLLNVAPEFVQNAPLSSFDPGVFDNELFTQRLIPVVDTSNPSSVRKVEGDIVEGTYSGTQVALTQAHSRIERAFASLYDVLGIEPTLPRQRGLEQQRQLYQFSAYLTNADGSAAQYPPHLQITPPDQAVSPLCIFNDAGLIETEVLLQKITPDKDGFIDRTEEWILDKARASAYGGDPEKGVRIQDVVDYNRRHNKPGTDITGGGNIGLLDDWYGDRRFADQQFTGTNPTTITQATEGWITGFSAAARAGGYDTWVTALAKADPKSLYVQDGSYFRKAVGVSDPAAVLHHEQPVSDECWTVGAVSLFQLHEDGNLHPVAICIDYHGSMENSVTIFNSRMTPKDSTKGEKADWPWRYAKTCAQTTDWMRHELAVHLTLSHFVEEAIIVAANRTLPMDHPVYRLLYPHWYKTLSLNAAARATLVPQIIVDLVGISPEQCYSFIRHAYDTYDFVGSYVPNDLRRRGFPDTQDGLRHPRYRNYAYAKNILALWTTLRTYVKSMLQITFPTDASVASDATLQNWAREVQTAAAMPSFPHLTTLDALADAVTMCIHIAAPFHSAVNYLQNFYQSFVAARPPALCSAPPTTLVQLRRYGEQDLVAALPVNRQRQWLLAAQLPWLLSVKVEADRSLLNYAVSQWNVARVKKGENDFAMRDASERLYAGLRGLQRVFFENSRGMSKGSVPYMVLDPGLAAVSILI